MRPPLLRLLFLRLGAWASSTRCGGGCPLPCVFFLGLCPGLSVGLCCLWTWTGTLVCLCVCCPFLMIHMRAFMETAGADLAHTPDIVLEGFDGPRTFTLIEVKTIDVAGASHVEGHHTDTSRGQAHVAVAQSARVGDYRLHTRPGGRGLPARMRHCVL